MRKMLSLILVFTLILSFSFTVVYAKDNSSEYLKPLNNLDIKNIDKVDKYLVKMGFSEEEINYMDKDIKINIASNGGKKLKLNKISTINNISEDTIEILRVDDDIFTLYDPIVIKKGEVNGGLEIEYDIYAQFKWRDTPEFAFTDTLALAWQEIVIPYGDATGQIKRTPASIPWTYEVRELIATEKIEGNYWEVDVFTGGGGDIQDGWGLQTVRVNKNHEGTTGVLEIGYAHKYTPGFVEPTISYASITFNLFSGKEYNDRYNFTY